MCNVLPKNEINSLVNPFYFTHLPISFGLMQLDSQGKSMILTQHCKIFQNIESGGHFLMTRTLPWHS